jgi:DNA-binding MarR family transcriptional regulator
MAHSHPPDPDDIDPGVLLDNLPCTHTALRRAARRLGNLYDDAIAPIGLKATQLGLLWQLDGLSQAEGAEDDAPGPTLQALAEQLAIGISSLTYALRPLVRVGLIALRPSPRDKRVKHAALTPEGRQRLADGVELWAVANSRAEKALGHADAMKLRALADKVSSKGFLEAYRAEGDAPKS